MLRANLVVAQMATTASKIVIGSDHGGFEMKSELVAYLRVKGVEVNDVGCPDTSRVDYPDIAAKVGAAIVSGEFGL